MEQEHHLTFGPFHLDGTQGCWWQGDQSIGSCTFNERRMVRPRL